MDVARELQVRRMGVVPYQDALDLQKDLVEERRAGRVPDQLLLLQHPPVITLGVKARRRGSNCSRQDGAATSPIMDRGSSSDIQYWICVPTAATCISTSATWKKS
jgi:lipoate-protein ligase B